MQKKALITGISGFVGSFLAEYIVKQDKYQVSGTCLNDVGIENLSAIKDRISLHKIDLTDAKHVSRLIKTQRPDYIFHLAGLAAVGDSFRSPLTTLMVNISIQLNLLEAIKSENLLSCRILSVSSAEAYGKVDAKNIPISETTPLSPISPYGVSKIAQDFLALQYFNSYNLSIIRVRPFNHIGPRQTPNFVISDFAKRIAEIEKKKDKSVITVGNLDTKRDFTDVRDIAEAYCMLIENGKIGEVYNIGSGVSYKIADLLAILLSFSKTKITVKTDPLLLRPSDIPELLSDNTKITNTIPWKPKIPIEQTLKETLDYWRNIV